MPTTTLTLISSMATKALLADLVAAYSAQQPDTMVAVTSVGGVDAACCAAIISARLTLACRQHEQQGQREGTGDPTNNISASWPSLSRHIRSSTG